MMKFIIVSFFFIVSCSNGETEKGVQIQEKADTTTAILATNFDRHPLPFCPEVYQEGIDVNATELKIQQDEIETEIKQVKGDTVPSLREKELRLIDLDIAKCIINDKLVYKLESICQGRDDSQPVETYDGTLGVSKDFVNNFSRSVGQLQWKYSFGNQFNGPDNSEGNVKGKRWCSGCLIANDLFITAGHCFDRDGVSWRLPRKNGQIISSKEIALLMKVNFNFQLSATTHQIRADTIDYPVLELKEYRNGNFDYAIIKLGRDVQGNLPGEKFGIVKISNDTATQVGIAGIIQHPKGDPKVIEAGPVKFVVSDLLGYNDIDTEGGSSGAAVISASTNKIIGIHIRGGCDFNSSNFNSATPIKAIIPSSPTLKSLISKQ
jgi:V8-like Glu-specific endopeptidase